MLKSKQATGASAFPGASQWKLTARHNPCHRQAMAEHEGEAQMRKATILKVMLIAGFLALAASAYAANTITLNSPASLNGKQVAAGQYDVKVNGDTVILLRNKAEVATAKARLEDRDSKARFNSVVTKANGSGLPSITEIQFEGKKQVLVIGDGAQASNESGSSSRQ
ncbi:MAG: hypothetical protein WA463_08930 [Terriglobales bacterium]